MLVNVWEQSGKMLGVQAALQHSQAAVALGISLARERDAVYTFLYVGTEEILTPLQEAWLEPNVWVVGELLASKHGLDPVSVPPPHA